jgi:hypothetical protein
MKVDGAGFSPAERELAAYRQRCRARTHRVGYASTGVTAGSASHGHHGGHGHCLGRGAGLDEGDRRRSRGRLNGRRAAAGDVELG